MVVNKKLKDLTTKELNKCGWIEKIAYRGDKRYIMYDFEAENFSVLRNKFPNAYDDMNVEMGKKWFALYKENNGSIILADIAKLDIGDGQEEAKKEINEFIDRILNSEKVIMGVARRETLYYYFVKAAALGQIEIILDELEGNDTRDMIVMKADGKKDLTEQIEKYKKIKEEFDKNKESYKEDRKNEVLRYIEELEAQIGKKALAEIIDR